MPKAAVLRHTDPLLDCPVLDGSATTQYKAAVKAANGLSLSLLEFLKRKTPQEQASWLKANVKVSRELFQPWSLEILFVLAGLDRARFTQLLDLLGLSSRTLSDKLKALRDAGLVERQIFDEQPVRIEYFLTRHGRRTTAVAAPLFTYLSHTALEDAHAQRPRLRQRAINPVHDLEQLAQIVAFEFGAHGVHLVAQARAAHLRHGQSHPLPDAGPVRRVGGHAEVGDDHLTPPSPQAPRVGVVSFRA
jgi:DNA-binding HxlR family transcriptional regulator